MRRASTYTAVAASEPSTSLNRAYGATIAGLLTARAKGSTTAFIWP